jgi:predicted nucleotide-binding protein
MVTTTRGMLPDDVDISCCFQQASRGIIRCLAAKENERSKTDRVTPEVCCNCDAGKIYRDVRCDQFTPDINVIPILTHDSVGYEALATVFGINCGEKLRQTKLEDCHKCDLASIGKAGEVPKKDYGRVVTAVTTKGEKVPMNQKLVRQFYPDYEKRKSVFLVFRQDNPIVPIVKSFLLELDLQPFELSQMVPFLEEEKHNTNYNCLEAGFKNCQAFLILLTPDDEAKKREGWVSDYEESATDYHFQPRPNVLLEIGMAFAFHGQGTVLVKIVSTQKENNLFVPLPTDMDGMRYIPLAVKGKIKGIDNEDSLKKMCEVLLRARCEMQNASRDLVIRIAKELESVMDLKEKRFTGRNKPDHIQGADWRYVDTQAGILQYLRFKIETSSTHWRAGFMLGIPNPGNSQPLPVHGGSLLFHVGKTAGRFGITIWEGDTLTHDGDMPLLADASISLSFTYTDNGVLVCKANGKDFPFENIDATLLNRVAILAWADGAEYVVNFRDIETRPTFGLQE